MKHICDNEKFLKILELCNQLEEQYDCVIETILARVEEEYKDKYEKK